MDVFYLALFVDDDADRNWVEPVFGENRIPRASTFSSRPPPVPAVGLASARPEGKFQKRMCRWGAILVGISDIVLPGCSSGCEVQMLEPQRTAFDFAQGSRRYTRKNTLDQVSAQNDAAAAAPAFPRVLD